MIRMSVKTNLFWDSCVFVAYFSDNRSAYDIDSIEQYIDDARKGSVDIYTCSIALAEIVPSSFKGGNYATFMQFQKDLRGSVKLIDLNPNVMLLAGRLKDLKYAKSGGERKLGTGDAVMLAACIHAIENYKIDIDAFHTFDAGKKRGLDGGKGMPLLGFEEWCSSFTGEDAMLAGKVINLNRCKPVHPSPKLDLSIRGTGTVSAIVPVTVTTNNTEIVPSDTAVERSNGGNHVEKHPGELQSFSPHLVEANADEGSHLV